MQRLEVDSDSYQKLMKMNQDWQNKVKVKVKVWRLNQVLATLNNLAILLQ